MHGKTPLRHFTSYGVLHNSQQFYLGTGHSTFLLGDHTLVMTKGGGGGGSGSNVGGGHFFRVKIKNRHQKNIEKPTVGI